MRYLITFQAVDNHNVCVVPFIPTPLPQHFLSTFSKNNTAL